MVFCRLRAHVQLLTRLDTGEGLSLLKHPVIIRNNADENVHSQTHHDALSSRSFDRRLNIAATKPGAQGCVT